MLGSLQASAHELHHSRGWLVQVRRQTTLDLKESNLYCICIVLHGIHIDICFPGIVFVIVLVFVVLTTLMMFRALGFLFFRQLVVADPRHKQLDGGS